MKLPEKMAECSGTHCLVLSENEKCVFLLKKQKSFMANPVCKERVVLTQRSFVSPHFLILLRLHGIMGLVLDRLWLEICITSNQIPKKAVQTSSSHFCHREQGGHRL